MPGVDLLDAFAELVVCVVFNLPRDQPPSSTTSSDEDYGNNDDDRDEDSLAGANSSGTTQIFSRVNSAGDSTSQLLYLRTPPPQMSPNTRDVAAVKASSTPLHPHPPPLSQLSSTHSMDLYPGGIWNPLARVQLTTTASSTSAAAAAAATPLALLPASVAIGQSSRPSSVASLNTGEVSTPRSGGQSTDRSAGFWSRLLGGSGVVQTPPRSASSGQLPLTGMTTTASSYVQLTEEDLGMLNASGRNGNGGGAGGMSGWIGGSTPPSLSQYSSPQQMEWTGAGDSRGAATTSSLSTPLYEASPAASCTQLPQQQQQQQRLNPHGLYVAAQHSSSPQGAQSQASSSSEFVVL